MSDESSRGLDFAILAEMLRAGEKQSGNLLEHLAYVLETAMPDQCTVKRSGGLFSTKKVNEILVCFDDAHLELARERNEGLRATEKQIVRGIALKTRELEVDAWITKVAQELQRVAQKNAKAREALSAFLTD